MDIEPESWFDVSCLAQVGLLPAAQDVFLDACRKPLAPDTRAISHPISLDHKFYKSGAVLTVLCCHSAAITKGEQVLWHDQYIKSAAELCQWEAIAECVSHRHPASAECTE
jgi:hypothetical protein